MPDLHVIRERWAISALAVGLVMLGACEKAANPAEVVSKASVFPVTATWNANVTAVGTSPVSGTFVAKQHLGSRIDLAMTIAGAPNAKYQWRIFRGDCATTAVAANNTAPTGLLLFATVQSYPDITLDASGAGSANPNIAGLLDSLTTYSVRVRVAQTSTTWNGTSPVACGNLQLSAGG